MPPRVRALIEEIAKKYSTPGNSITIADIIGDRRARQSGLIAARQECYWQLWCNERHPVTGQRLFSTPRIGKWLHRDHSTVMFGARKHAKKLEVIDEKVGQT